MKTPGAPRTTRQTGHDRLGRVAPDDGQGWTRVARRLPPWPRDMPTFESLIRRDPGRERRVQPHGTGTTSNTMEFSLYPLACFLGLEEYHRRSILLDI